jgi:hypothetical protein
VGLPHRWITRVAIDPTDNQRLYVTLSGFHLDEYLPHVFTSADGGSSWTDISSNLPGIPLNDIIVDPDNPSWLYVASDIGVFWSVNRGMSWQPLGVGFPNAPVHSIHLHNGSRRLVAGTHGRSSYAHDLGTATAVSGPEVPPVATVAVAPNPTRGSATLRFDLPRAGTVTAEVFDVRGALVARLADREFAAGQVALTWNGTDRRGRRMGAGAYFYRVQTPDGRQIGKIVVTR